MSVERDEYAQRYADNATDPLDGAVAWRRAFEAGLQEYDREQAAGDFDGSWDLE